MSGDVPVRFCERLGVRLPRATHRLVHCRTLKQAEQLKLALQRRLAECGLEMHPDKTRIVYCMDGRRQGKYPHTSFDFLGYTFRPRGVKTDQCKRLLVGFNPAVSRRP